MSMAAAMLVALAVDAALGWPGALFRRLSHPVVWIGALISACEARWNHGGRARRIGLGALTVAVVVAVSAGVAAAVMAGVMAVLPEALRGGWVVWALTGVLAWPFVAVRSLYDHVAAVARPLGQGDLAGGRAAVAMIVGRDVARLDEAGVARAGIESLAENASDGVIAPLFWGVVLGLPGIVAYKAINTMDSMIGHRSERYEAFGKVAARVDDLANWLPARLTGALFALAAGARAGAAMAVIRADAAGHRSPNAGWPEGAMAGGIAVRLSGPRVYETHVAEEPWLNSGAPDPDGAAMARALRLYVRAMALAALGLAGLAMV